MFLGFFDLLVCPKFLTGFELSYNVAITGWFGVEKGGVNRIK